MYVSNIKCSITMETETNCHQMFVAGNIWNFSLTATKLSKKFESPFPHCVDLFSQKYYFDLFRWGLAAFVLFFTFLFSVCMT